MRAGAEVATHPAAPDGEGQPLTWRDPPVLGALAFRGTALRNGPDLLLPYQDFLGDIKRAIAGTPVEEICVAVIAGADDVQVPVPVVRGQAAGAGPIAIALFVGQ
jgi:hypothetical protein